MNPLLQHILSIDKEKTQSDEYADVEQVRWASTSRKIDDVSPFKRKNPNSTVALPNLSNCNLEEESLYLSCFQNVFHI